MSDTIEDSSNILENKIDSVISESSQNNNITENNILPNEEENQNVAQELEHLPEKDEIKPEDSLPKENIPKENVPKEKTPEIDVQKEEAPKKSLPVEEKPKKDKLEIQPQKKPIENIISPRKSISDIKASLFQNQEESTNKNKSSPPIVHEAPTQNTKNLVDKWEIIKQDNEKIAKASQYNNERNDRKSISSSRKVSANLAPMTNLLNSGVNKRGSILEETRMEDHIPEITKKFSMKDKRLRESIKTFNKSYNTANIDLKNTGKKIVTVKPLIKEKRVYMEDEDDNEKVQRSKRVKVSELSPDNNTSKWHKVNSSLFSFRNIFNRSKTENDSNKENVNVNEKGKIKDKGKGKANESVIITPTVKNQEVTEPVRLNEVTCLNIFNPAANKSTIPMLLRLRRRSSVSEDKANSMFNKSNTKPEWINKLYMVISNENSIPKLFDIPVHWTSLSSQLVYILDLSGEALIQINGSKCRESDKEYAQRICKRIGLNDNVPDIFEYDQDNAYKNNSVPLDLFWKAVELDNYNETEKKNIITKNDDVNLNDTLEKNKEKIDIEKAIYIYRINEQTNSLDLIHNGSFPTFRCLNSNVSMIFDFVGEVYLWQGKNSSLSARSTGIKFAQKIFNDYSRPSWANLRKINEGHEPIIFQEKFKDSYLFF